MRSLFKHFINLTIFLLIANPLISQQVKKKMTLSDAIVIAQRQSPDALSAKNRFLKSFWEMRTSEATLLPKLSLDATVPRYTRAIEKIVQPDGSEAFRERSLANTSADLSLSKNIALTGGQVYLQSGLQRIDYLNIGDAAGRPPTAWLSTPLVIGYSQNIFGFNTYKWSKKIDPMRYNEAKRKYLEEIEQISINTTNLFFNLLVSQIQKNVAEQNIAYYDTLYKIGLGRFNLGKIGENELLQLELGFLNAQANYETSALELEDRMFKLKSYLRLQDDIPIEPTPPIQEVSFFEIPADKAVELANKNNSQALSFDRRLLEADRQVNIAKTTDRFSANMFAQYGLTQSANSLSEVYHNTQDQQLLVFGIKIPILDWGLAKGRIKVAESDREIVRTSIEQERVDFDQSVFLQVMDFKMQQRRLQIAGKSDTVAWKSYDIARQRYLVDKVSITDLTTSQINSDNSKINYIRSLQNYWINYFQIRKLTMFDFDKNEEISINFDLIR
ncbi:MAG: TolC family protein [Bacteroidales bacterium]|jgi:outer membrane protein TolC|nr:TolC family protein [Bacteroidales bacterium]MDI9591833.1 TolC family protein [Bacteroidota bacterium]HOF80051.1 TolC family protein [Bacteroidales bacterium]HOR75370.1 TolC family protein [Bacteroidales bacterium]HPL10782.1 TolC family protein [Bacteroidales bacterium]